MQSAEATPLHAAAPQTASLSETAPPVTTLPIRGDVRSHSLLAAIGHTRLIGLSRVGELLRGVRPLEMP